MHQYVHAIGGEKDNSKGEGSEGFFFVKNISKFCPKSIYLSAKKYILFPLKDISFVFHSYIFGHSFLYE